MVTSRDRKIRARLMRRASRFTRAIDGHELAAPLNPDSLLIGVTGEVALTIAPSATAPRRAIVVTPLQGEFGLGEASWIAENRARVDRMSGGRVAYVYL